MGFDSLQRHQFMKIMKNYNTYKNIPSHVMTKIADECSKGISWQGFRKKDILKPMSENVETLPYIFGFGELYPIKFHELCTKIDIIYNQHKLLIQDEVDRLLYPNLYKE